MEFKKKTIIWEDNNEPPKDYIWIKSDGKAYEYSYSQRKWIESKSISGSGNYEPVEVNPTIEDGDVTIPLNALKIGESIYTIGGDSDSDIQIVELTYDHLPATGTLSASDLEKLDGDNCLLIINGRYFYKTFSANIGFDYHEIASANVLGGVRSIYFTASKPDGEYTIAYTYPVEANTQTQANAVLENIKVGNTTYSVPLSPMIVEGTIDENNMFTPGSGAPTFAEAKEHMFAGGLLYFLVTEDGEPFGVALASMANANEILAIGPDQVFVWMYTVEPDMTISINSYGENYYYDSNFAYNFVELDEDEVEAANAVRVDVYELDISTPDSYILTRNTDEHDPVLFSGGGNDYMILIVTKDAFESEDVQVPEGVITNDYNYVVVMSERVS